MSETNEIPQMKDRRSKIVGVVPKNAHAMVLAGLAFLMIVIILFSGRSTPRKSPPPPPATLPLIPDQTRIVEYRKVIDDQMRKLSAEEAELAKTKRTLNAGSETPSLSQSTNGYAQTAYAPPVNPTESAIAADRLKRDYQSLFASNIALSLRSPAAPEPAGPPATASGPAKPVAAAETTPRYRLFEGTFLETVLTNRLDSSFSGPVNCMVTTPVYYQDTAKVLIPQGTRVLGEVRKLENFGEQRLAVVFHRMIFPNGSSVDLDQFKGLDQVGQTGLRDQVNHHYMQVFGVSVAIGAIAGLAQRNTRYNLDESAGAAYQQGVSNSLSQSALHILDRYLNVLPTFTIREGCRVKVYLSQDLSLPEYDLSSQNNF